MRPSTIPLIITSLLWMMINGGVQAASLSAEPEPVSTNELSLHKVVEAAWLRLPEQALLRQLQQASQESASPLWWDQPSVLLDYQSEDDTGVNTGLAAEWQVSVELPIAGPSLWRTQRRLKEAQQNLVLAEQQMLRWRLSGELVRLVNAINREQASVSFLQQQQAFDQEALRWMETLQQLGDRPMEEVLQIRQDYLLSRSKALAARQRLTQLQQRWAQMTGLQQQPVLSDNVTLSPVPQLHPFLAWRDAQVAVARQQLKRSRLSRKAASWRVGYKEVEAFGVMDKQQAWQLGVSIPFGRPTVGSLSSEYSALGQAQSELVTSQRQLQIQQHTVRQSIAAKREEVTSLAPLLEELEALFPQRYQAYQQGRISALEWQPLKQRYWQLQQQLTAARLQQTADTHRLAYLEGVMP